MSGYIAYIITAVMIWAVYADVRSYHQMAQEPANLDGYRLVQLALDQGEAWLDSYPPQDACYAEWWALERSALAMFSESLRYHVMGNDVYSDVFLDAATILQAWAGEVEQEIDCG